MPHSILHYQIIEKLGEGGMGIVHLALDTRLNRKVALKFLPRHVSRDPSERQRFLQEAQAAARLNHPNIAQVYAIEEAGEELFIVMEYVEGRELHQVMKEENLSHERKMEISVQMAQGIQAAHREGIIHRDIKSRNIMVNREGRVKIMDFGVARLLGSDHITKTGTTIGTTAYMSPEQLAGYELDARSDIWSYGVVLYELFTGTLPFRGMYEPAVIYAISEEEPPAPSEAAPEIDSRAEQVILGCLVKDRERRYGEMGEVLGDLAGSAGLKPPVNRVFGAASGGYRWKNSVLAVSVPLLLIISAGLFLMVPESRFWEGTKVPLKKYLAVLPIENIGDYPEMKAICDGLAETFSHKLSRLGQFQDSYWVAPASEMRKEQIRSASQANRQFGVNLAVLSSLQSFEDSLRLIVELVDADNMRQLGTDRVSVPAGDLAMLERAGVEAMLRLMQIEINSDISRTLAEGAPSNPRAYEYYLKGRASLQSYANVDSLNSAIRFFSESVEEDPEFALGYAGLGESYWRKYEATRQGEYVETARNSLNRALELNSRLAVVQELLGRLSVGTGDQVEAIIRFSRALEIYPGYTPAYRGLARVYQEQGDSVKAVQTYRKAIELNPGSWEGYKDLGLYYFQRAEYNAAAEQFQRVVEITPRNSMAWSNLGAAYFYGGQKERAWVMYESSLELDRNPVVANNVAALYYYEGNYLKAAEMYGIALESFSNRYDMWGNQAVAFDLSGQPEKARRSYLTAIEKARQQLEVNPDDPRVLADLAAFYSDVEDSLNAIHYISKATAVAGDNRHVRKRAVFTYENLGMRAEALRWITPSMINEIESEPEFREMIDDPSYLALKKNLISPD